MSGVPPGLGTRGLFLLVLLTVAIPAHARPKVLVVVADHLTLADVTRPDLPGLTRLRVEGQSALMSPGVPHGPDPVATVYATLGAGDSVAVGDVSQGRMAVALRSAGLRTALIGTADGDDTGSYQPVRLILPVPDTFSDLVVADPIAPGGRCEEPQRLWAQTQTSLRTADLVLVHFGDFARLEREQRQGDLLPVAYAAHRRRALQALDRYLSLVLASASPNTSLLLLVPTPPLTSRGGWTQLTPILLYPGIQSRDEGLTVSSDTTQTFGLVAARDIAPTVLNWLGVPVPIQMTGATMRPVNGSGMIASDALAYLTRLDRQTRLNQEAQDPLFWGIGLIAPAIIFPCLALFLLGRLSPGSILCRLALYGMNLLAAWPLALLLAPMANRSALGSYLGVIALAAALLALIPTPTLIFSLTALVLVADSLLGITLVSQSVLSSYALAGIRFYGIGNEYMGLLIGGALLTAAMTRKQQSSTSSFHPAPPGLGAGWVSSGVALWFILVVFILSCPAFGAKAGGAVTATATFTLAWLRLRGVRLKIRHLLAGLLAGFALVFLWALAGDILHLRRTHLESSVVALEGGRFGYIVGVAWRKVGLAARVFFHPGTLLGLLALALVGLAARTALWPQIAAYYARRSRLASVSEAGLWGCGVCVVFNDSGIVAAILLLMCLILPVLHGLFQTICVSSPSMSATSESALPSATL